LVANTTGANNTAVGSAALGVNLTGSNNTAMGSSCLNTTTGNDNTGFGYAALQLNTSGSFNTAIGDQALSSNTTGSSNTAVGMQTSSGNFSNCIILGRRATATANNQFVVGSSTENAGSVVAEVNTSANVWNVVINGVARKILLA